MAHEINNPLGGMFNALDSLKRYGAREDVRSTSIRLLEQGLSGIRDLVRSTLDHLSLTDQRPRDLTVTDLDDLRLLVKPEARAAQADGSNWRMDFSGPVHVPAVPVRDAILNLLLNACHSVPGERQRWRCRCRGWQAFTAEVTDQGKRASGAYPRISGAQGCGSRATGSAVWAWALDREAAL